MILPVNVNPSITSYAHHSYPLAIMEMGKDYNLVSVLLNIESDLLTEVVKNDTDVITREHALQVKNKKYAMNTEFFAMKMCSEQEELVLELQNYRQDIVGGGINLIVTGEDYLKSAHENKDFYRIGIICGKGLLCSENNEYKEIPLTWTEKKNCKKIRIQRKGNEVGY